MLFGVNACFRCTLHESAKPLLAGAVRPDLASLHLTLRFPVFLPRARIYVFCVLYVRVANLFKQASRAGLNRFDRAMINPLDVRDDFALEDARVEAERMLDRPMDMVFHCQTDGGDGDGNGDSDDHDEQEAEFPEEDSDPAPQVCAHLAVGMPFMFFFPCLGCYSLPPQVQCVVQLYSTGFPSRRYSSESERSCYRRRQWLSKGDDGLNAMHSDSASAVCLFVLVLKSLGVCVLDSSRMEADTSSLDLYEWKNKGGNILLRGFRPP